MVGRSGASTNPEGISLSQSVLLTGNADYNFSFNWSVYPYVNVYNSSGGIFELLINGTVLNQATAPVTVPGLRVYGQVSATYHAPASGQYTLSVRITRTVPAGEEVVQFVDNIMAQPACYANCDYSSSAPILNAGDFQCFLNKYAAGDAYANCDGSTASPALTVNDFQCFLNRFAAGCP